MRRNKIIYLFLISAALFSNARCLRAGKKEDRALRRAARRCSYEDVVNLVDKGANVQTLDKKQRTLLHLVMKFGAGVLGDEALFLVDPDEALAGIEEFESIVSFLVDNGVSINAQDCDGKTAFHYAAMGLRVVIEPNLSISTLLKHGASAETTDHQGRVPADFVIRLNWRDYIKRAQLVQNSVGSSGGKRKEPRCFLQ